MPINRPVKKLTALVLAGAAVTAATQAGAQPGGAQAAARPACTTTNDRGNPNAVPPVLRPARPSELAAIRAAEARQGQALYYDPPATARYSDVEMNAHASVHK
jgi:hypothetical protein